MTILQNYFLTLKNFSWKGRASRKEFWTFNLVNVAIFFLLGILFADDPTGLEYAFIIMFLLIMIQNFTLNIRRLHDINMHGWWLLLNAIPYVGSLILLILFCFASQDGTNRFGPHPYAKQEDSCEEFDELGNSKDESNQDDPNKNKLVF